MRSLVSSPFFFCTLCTYLCGLCDFPCICLLCRCWPKLEQQECEITSARGISCLCRAEKICFGQTTQSISVLNKLCLLPARRITSYLLKTCQQLNCIITYMVSHGWRVLCLCLKYSADLFLSPLLMTQGASEEKDKQPSLLYLAEALTENQCSVSHEHLISGTLVHRWNAGNQLFVYQVDRAKCERDTFWADKVSERWGVNT